MSENGSQHFKIAWVSLAIIGIAIFVFGLVVTLWYYPIFWLAHFLGGLPPGQDHIHQVVFIVLSLISLLICTREFFPRGVVQHT